MYLLIYFISFLSLAPNYMNVINAFIAKYLGPHISIRQNGAFLPPFAQDRGISSNYASFKQGHVVCTRMLSVVEYCHEWLGRESSRVSNSEACSNHCEESARADSHTVPETNRLNRWRHHRSKPAESHRNVSPFS